MAPVRFDIWWSETEHKTFKVDNDLLVGEIVSEIKEQLGHLLPESDAAHNVIEYVLFKTVQGHREPLLARMRTLAQVRVVEGEELYLANSQAPWWIPQPNERHPLDRLAPGSQPLEQPAHCRLQLAAKCVVEIPPTGVALNRKFLLKELPVHLVRFENARSFAGLRSRLHAVSRHQHCAIVPHGTHWLVHAYDYTYLAGRTLTKGMSAQVSCSMSLVLGRDGWPIDIHLPF